MFNYQSVIAAIDPRISTAINVQFGLLFFGALFLLVFFMILLLLKTRDRIYLYYSLFLSFSLIEAAIFMRDAELMNGLFGISSQSAAVNLEVATLLAFAAYCLFTTRLLNVRAQDKRLFRWICMMSFSTMLYCIVYYLFPPVTAAGKMNAFIVSRIVILLTGIVAILWILSKKIKSLVKGYFLVGTACYFLGALVAVLRETISGVPFSSFYKINSETYFQGGVLMEVLFFTLALSVRIYFSYEEKQRNQIKINALAIYEKEQAQAEALALRIQINPHFLFNYLNLLKYYIQIGQNSGAIKYLVKFSQFIREVLESSQKSTISLSQEISMLEHYFALEQIRFEGNFVYRVKVDGNIDISRIMIPPLLLQPFAEDILWNGIYENDDIKREISISIRQSDDYIIIAIAENESDKISIRNRIAQKFARSTNRELNMKRIALFNKNQSSKISYPILVDEEFKIESKPYQTIIKIKKMKED